jgi:hypothetical protein
VNQLSAREDQGTDDTKKSEYLKANTAWNRIKNSFNSGDTAYQPPGEWHIVTTASEGAKTLVFRIVKRGQPMVVEVDQ